MIGGSNKNDDNFPTTVTCFLVHLPSCKSRTIKNDIFPELSVLVIDIKYLGVFNSKKYLNGPSIINMVPESLT